MFFNFSHEYISFLISNIPEIITMATVTMAIVAAIVTALNPPNTPRANNFLAVTSLSATFPFALMTVVVLALSYYPAEEITPNIALNIFWAYIITTAIQYCVQVFVVFTCIKNNPKSRILWIVILTTYLIYPLVISKYYFYILQINNAAI